MSTTTASIRKVTLDDASIIKRSPEVEHERRVALVDITHTNDVTILGAPELHPPYDLFISVRDNRLTLRFTTDETTQAHDVTLPLIGFRGIIKDYFLMCEQYYDAIKHSASDRLQTLDMARRGVHNEGSEMLQSQLSDRLDMDFATARRLFTLICVLHIK
ncbi:MAG: UPF0262 family protein [Rickettsiales bacterium]